MTNRDSKTPQACELGSVVRAMRAKKYILAIEWDRPSSDSLNPPNLIGPFQMRSDAEDWAAANVPNGSWEVRRLAWPYYDRAWYASPTPLPREFKDPAREWLRDRTTGER